MALFNGGGVLGFFDIFRAKKKEERAIYGNISDFWYQDIDGHVTPQFAMRVSAVFACIRLLSDSISVLPITVTGADKNKSNIVSKNPNQTQTKQTFYSKIMIDMLTHGASFVKIVRTGSDIQKLVPIQDPSSVIVAKTSDDDLVFSVKERNKDGQTVENKYLLGEIAYFLGMSIDGYCPLSVIKYHQLTIGMAHDALQFGSRVFKSDGRPSGVLEVAETMSQEAKSRLGEAWQRAFSGTGKSHKTAVLDAGMKYHRINITPEEAQYLETRKFQVNDIARIFGVPPHMIGDLERSTFNNIEHQGLEYVKYTLLPWIERIEQTIERDIFLSDGNVSVNLNPDFFLRGDISSRYAAYNTGRNGGWLSVNDIRESEGMKKIDGGDKYLTPLNMQEANKNEK